MATTSPYQTEYKTIILGAGAAGLFCAGQMTSGAGPVLILDHAKKPAEKVRISGGGRCNFTNIHTEPSCFLSQNPHFAKSALSRYTPYDFMDRLQSREISWHEKTLGQLFCDGKSAAIIDMLVSDARTAGSELCLGTEIQGVAKTETGFRVEISSGVVSTQNLIIATGGLSVPKMGATGFAYDIARQFGHNIIETRPGLVPFVFTDQQKDRFAEISGVACDVRASTNGKTFDEAMLFTHRGLSGPAILQISSYWFNGDDIHIDLLSAAGGANAFCSVKREAPKISLQTAFERIFPKRLAYMLLDDLDLDPKSSLGTFSDKALLEMDEKLARWTLRPAGTEGWRTAEVTVGGVDTNDLSSKTMESRLVEGLYFIGECVDVTGWLGGYNFQWAWASGYAAARAISD